MNNFARDEEVMIVNGCSPQKALLAGVLGALTIVLLLGLVGTSAGFSLFSPRKTALYTLSISPILWLVFLTIASTYVGGWVASYVSPGKTCKISSQVLRIGFLKIKHFFMLNFFNQNVFFPLVRIL